MDETALTKFVVLLSVDDVTEIGPTMVSVRRCRERRADLVAVPTNGRHICPASRSGSLPLRIDALLTWTSQFVPLTTTLASNGVPVERGYEAGLASWQGCVMTPLTTFCTEVPSSKSEVPIRLFSKACAEIVVVILVAPD